MNYESHWGCCLHYWCHCGCRRKLVLLVLLPPVLGGLLPVLLLLLLFALLPPLMAGLLQLVPLLAGLLLVLLPLLQLLWAQFRYELLLLAALQWLLPLPPLLVSSGWLTATIDDCLATYTSPTGVAGCTAE